MILRREVGRRRRFFPNHGLWETEVDDHASRTLTRGAYIRPNQDSLRPVVGTTRPEAIETISIAEGIQVGVIKMQSYD